MARILILSSWVAHGHVGLSAAAPALQALGHTVTQLATVQLSNHPGWPHMSGRQVPVEEITGTIAALGANGWLQQFDTLLSGYLPSPGHVDVACDLAERLRADRPDLQVVVDPILGDRPKGLYVSEDAAAALRARLVPMADRLTPNAFELGWLSGRPTTTLAGTLDAAERLRQLSGGAEILVTSPPVSGDETGLLSVSEKASLFRVPMTDPALVPHGAGDVFSALVAGGLAPGAALGRLQAIVAASLGAPHLRIAETAATWKAAAPIPAEAIDPAAADTVR